VYPVLLYGIEIYANTTKNHINRLMILNNKILRITQNKPLRYDVTELYKNFNTLPLPELHKFQLLCLVHKYYYCKDQLPSTFSSYFQINHDIHHHHTRSSDHIHLSAVKTSLGAKSIKFKASQMWNNLPTQLRKIANHHTFKKTLKHYLINKL